MMKINYLLLNNRKEAEMKIDAREARNAYMREYRAKNKDHINMRERERRKADPERYKKYQTDYWQRKAEAMSKS